MSVEEFGGAPALIAPGMIMRYTVSLGQDHAVQFEASFDRDSELDMRHSLDVCFKEGNRLLGRNQLPILRRQLEGKEQQLQDNLVRKAEVLAKMETLKGLRRDKAVELNTEHDRMLRAAQDEWIGSGRRGEFKPVGHLAGSLKNLEAQVEQLTTGQAKDDGDAAQQLGVLDGEIKECHRAVDQLKKLIAEAEAMCRGEDVSGITEE
jgi:hypothetical protein